MSIKKIVLISLLAILVAVALLYKVYYPSKSIPKSLNISCFTYRDINRDGKYDMGDRPYAGLIIDMERPGLKPVTQDSNLAGFTNFKMRLNVDKYDVYKPGEYQVAAQTPEGWQITSNNANQTLHFSELEGSPAGIVLDKTCEPIGVAPELSISGSVDMSAIEKSYDLNVKSVSGESQSVSLSEGKYFLPASPGDWELEWIVNDETVSRSIVVKDYAVVVSGFNVDRHQTKPKGNLVKADYDTFTISDSLYELPFGYLNLNWVNWVSTHQKLYGGDGYLNATISSEYMTYNSSGHLGVVWSETPFDFVGTYVGVAWPQAEKHDVIFRGMRDGKIIYEDKIKAYTEGAVYFDADYRNIDRLEIGSAANWQVVLDDTEFRTQ